MTKIVEQVLERLSESMEKAIERLVDKAVKSMNQALEARIAALEAKIEDRLSSNQHCNERQHSGPGESNSALQNQILRLQHSVARQEHAANFVMSGVPEKESTADESPENSVLQACKDLQIHLSVSDLVEVRRLGRPSQAISRSRPRPLLVKTANKEIKTRIVTQGRANRRENRTVYFNEDLTKEEEARRKTLVPTYKELRKKAVKCRLERACIMIDERMIFDQGEAEAVLRSLHSPLHVPTSSPGSSPASRNLLKSFGQAASAVSQ